MCLCLCVDRDCSKTLKTKTTTRSAKSIPNAILKRRRPTRTHIHTHIHTYTHTVSCECEYVMKGYVPVCRCSVIPMMACGEMSNRSLYPSLLKSAITTSSIAIVTSNSPYIVPVESSNEPFFEPIHRMYSCASDGMGMGMGMGMGDDSSLGGRCFAMRMGKGTAVVCV